MATLDPALASEPVARFEAHRRELIAQRRLQTLLLAACFIVAVVVSANVADLLPGKLAAGLPKVGGYIEAITPTLKLPVLFGGIKTEGSLAYWYFNLPKYLRLLLETVNMALFATCLGTTGAMLLCFPASRNLVRSPWVYFAARRLTEFCRGVPDIIFAIRASYAARATWSGWAST